MYINDKEQKMKKQSKKHSRETSAESNVEEIYVPYDTAPKTYSKIDQKVDLENFSYSSFKVILDKSPFIISEWAQLLYLSERTMHRYAKENTSFNGLQAERILILENLIDTGIDFFGKEGLKQWIRSTPFSLQGVKVFDCLFTYQGIQASIDTLKRSQHGIPA